MTPASASTFNMGIILLHFVLPCLLAFSVAQYFLAKAKNPFLGWILPILFFLSGLILALANLTDDTSTREKILWILLLQIPTVIQLLILGVTRHGRKKTAVPPPSPDAEEMKRMNIQDL